eukprot:TRINITY_DN54898_c0_g1_i1.p1 TRINITY_DN54898_c0_g1~~TRINITY_DN54898_c0_g1_i1.p1  ORF type:complete len:869 (-),score=111.65 TRINITY_DN54898_c0_g1_i1:284-2890(-)
MSSLRWPLLLALLTAGSAVPTPPFDVKNYDYHIKANGAVAYWKISGDVLMLALAGEGWWTGFGMNERPTMQYADIVICQQSQEDPDLIEAVDYHATANSQPKLDSAQDWFVVSSGRVATPLTTWCELKRSLTTCGLADDWQITDVEKIMHGLLAWSGRGAAQSSKISYHGGNRRHQLMSFDGKTSEEAGSSPPKSGGSGGGWSFDDTAITAEFTIPSVTVPPKSGSNVYTYSKIALPSGTKPYHAIAWRVRPDKNSASVLAGLNHHMTLHKCAKGIPGATVGKEVSPWAVMKHCESWLGGVNTLPEDEGIPFDGAGSKDFFVVVERHFYNPSKKTGVMDTNGKAAIEYTDNLRPKVMSQLTLMNLKINVPGKTYGYVHRSHCPSECTKKMGAIRVARAGFHAHAHTSAATLRHIRNGVEMEPILHVQPYDDSLAFSAVDRTIQPGDELIMDCVYNNDMDKEITFGEAIEQEMCIATLDIIGSSPVKACFDAPPPQAKWEGYDAACSWCVTNNNYKDFCAGCDLSNGLVGCPKHDKDPFVLYNAGRFGDPNSKQLSGDRDEDRKILKYTPFQLNAGKKCTAEDGYVEEVTMGKSGSCPAGTTVSGSYMIPFTWGGGLTISWDAVCDDQEVTFTVWRVRNAATGWMAFGMHDAGTVDSPIDMPSNRMAGADIMQFTVEDSSMKDAKGIDYTMPRVKTTPVATLISAERENGRHTAVFKRPFKSPDGVTLGPDGFVWIIGAVNAFNSDKGVKHLSAFVMDAEPISLFGGIPTKRVLRQTGMKQNPTPAPQPTPQSPTPASSPTPKPQSPTPASSPAPTPQENTSPAPTPGSSLAPPTAEGDTANGAELYSLLINRFRVVIAAYVFVCLTGA